MRIDERVENSRIVHQLSEEKKKLEKKHASLLDDIRNFIDNTENRVLEDNLAPNRTPACAEMPQLAHFCTSSPCITPWTSFLWHVHLSFGVCLVFASPQVTVMTALRLMKPAGRGTLF
jgi:hypothetical protein